MESTTSFETLESLMRSFATHVNPGKVRAFEGLGATVVMGRREGARFWDAYSGEAFFDCHCNGGVFNLGHRNPMVRGALTRALETLDIGNHHLLSGPRAALAAKLARSTRGALGGVVFGACGGEANDLAIKVARAATGRRGIVSASGGYHGHTGLSLAAGDPTYRDPFGPNLPGFCQVPYDDIAALERAVGDDTAAVLLEAIPATFGMLPPREGYLRAVANLCRERGALLILDEVQTGLGRTGTCWYFEQEDIVPDILTTGKGLSGGLYPIAATLMRAELHRFFEDHPFIHISTFGGAELGCAAAMAVLDQVTEPRFLVRVRALAERFALGLEGLPLELRQRGLFMGLKFVAGDGGIGAMKRLFRAGIFSVFAAGDPSVLQFLPPLILRDDEADEIIERVRGALR